LRAGPVAFWGPANCGLAIGNRSKVQNLAVLTNDATGFSAANSVNFSYGASCNGECDLFALLGSPITNLFAGLAYPVFMNDSTNGTNSDYLVWKGSTIASSDIPPGNDVPEPGSLALLGGGLLALGMVSRRRRT